MSSHIELIGNNLDRLQSENDALRAALERLRHHASHAVDRLQNAEQPYAAVLSRVVDQTEKQSLAEIEAAAVEKAMAYEFPVNEETEYHTWTLSECRRKLKNHAIDLRQQGEKP